MLAMLHVGLTYALIDNRAFDHVADLAKDQGLFQAELLYGLHPVVLTHMLTPRLSIAALNQTCIPHQSKKIRNTTSGGFGAALYCAEWHVITSVVQMMIC